MLILKPFEFLVRRGFLALLAKNEVARFEGIIISDPKNEALFRETVVAALQLIKELDPRRFRRIRRYITWIVNVMLPHGGARYAHSMRTCKIDFEKSALEPYGKHASVLCASTLVHEATHGVIRARNIPYSAELRSRIEQLCVREEERFLSKVKIVQPDAVRLIDRRFDESQWNKLWNESRLGNFKAFITRLSTDARTR